MRVYRLMSILRLTEEEYAKRLKAKAERAKKVYSTPVLTEYGKASPLRVSIVLDWPPTANTNVRHGAGGHYKTAAYKSFQADVAVRVVVIGAHKHPLEGRLRVTMHACPADLRARDLDNLVKPILDSLQAAGVFRNDSAVDDLRILRTIGGEPGTVAVFLEVM